MTEIKVSKVPFVKIFWLSMSRSVVALFLQAVGRFDAKTCEEYISWWWKEILVEGKATLNKVETSPLDPEQPYLYMSNHISALDIPAMFAGVHPRRLRMVAKKQVSQIPLFGRALTKMDFVFIDRKSRKAIEQLAEAKKVIEKGVSVWMAPEGTRSRTGKLGPFKRGGFHLAIQLGLPIIPTWLEGTGDIMPPGSMDFALDGHIDVRFGEPVQTLGCTKKDIPRLMKEVRESMLELSQHPRDWVDGGNQRQDRVEEPLQPGWMRTKLAEQANQLSQ